MKFSLVTVTMGDRPEQLERLRKSLDAQTWRDFEWIVVDHRDHPELRGGLSRARNCGISMAKGDAIAFPDDDAWYEPDTLAQAAAALADAETDGISFRVVDGNGVCSAGGWMSAAKKSVTRATVWHTAVSCSFFLKRGAIGEVRFNEKLGAGSGTRFGSGEETDFLLRLIGRGAHIRYDGTRHVFHPQPSGRIDVSKGWRYGNGYGSTLRRHHYSPCRLFWACAAQFARALQALARLSARRCAFHLAMCAGRFCGYVSPAAP